MAQCLTSVAGITLRSAVRRLRTSVPGSSALLVYITMAGLAGCISRQAVVTSSQMQGATTVAGFWVREELFFGLNTPTGMVSDSAWQSFLEQQVVPRLPDGFTVFESVGYYRDARTDRTLREPSRVLLVYYREGQAQISRALTELISIYKRLFDQQSVLRVTSQVRATT